MAAADQTTDPDGGLGADAEALILSLGVTVGDRLDGRYRLDRVLHTTGPAITWLATDEKLNRPNRIHLLRSDQPRAEAFMAAARAAAAMADNHFVQVLDAVPDDGLYYVITEWLHDGHTLGEVLSGGPVPVTEAVRITTELARAITEAHDQGLAHLRLSPKTVLRTDTGEVKILDLCLAAALTGTVSRDPLGTDLSAIGELAYALLTGRRPQQPEPVPPSELRSEVTPQLDDVILRILGDGPAGPQYQTPTEVADALAQLPRPRYEAPLPSTPQTAPLRHQQTTVMPAMPAGAARTTAMPQVAPSYQPAPPRPTAHGAPARPGSYDEDEYRPRGGGSGAGHGGSRGSDHGGGGGGRNSSALIGVGALAAVVAVALLAYTMFSGSGSGSKGNQNAGNTSTSNSQAATTGSSQAAPSAGVTAASVSVYDEDNGKEGAGYLVGGQISDKGWITNQYCGPNPTHSGDPKSTGLIFDLGSVKTITSATVTIGTAGAAMEMQAADASVTQVPALVPGSAPAGFKSIATADAGGTTVTLKAASPVSTRFVLIWFNKSLPAVPNPDKTITCAKDSGNRYGDSIMSVKFNAS
ncbi:serine/threonine protein kinase [Catenulispora sp. EB89]|uniref:serine/threonine protein kinase n=1 Tax=Catenulispora sp. EB89 TaxID=3156257 RepID=UPI003514689C